MKKLTAFLLVLVLVLSLAACGKKEEPKEPEADKEEVTEKETEKVPGPEEKYDLDLKSPETQPMSTKKATREVMAETIHGWLGDVTIYEGSRYAELTYADFAEHIGCDATEYYYDADNEAGVYTWIAEERNDSKIAFWFKDSDGCVLYGGAVNIPEE